MDWRILSLIVMLAIGVYSVAFKKFFADGGDWRVFLPVIGIVGLAALAYFAFSYKEVKFDSGTTGMAVIVMVSIGASALFSLIVYADKTAPISQAMPIMGLSVVVTAVLAIVFLKEAVTLNTWVGIVLAVASIVFLSMK